MTSSYLTLSEMLRKYVSDKYKEVAADYRQLSAG